MAIVVAPDIFAVYNTGKKGFICGKTKVFDQFQRMITLDKIESYPSKRQRGDLLVAVAQIAEIAL